VFSPPQTPQKSSPIPALRSAPLEQPPTFASTASFAALVLTLSKSLSLVLIPLRRLDFLPIMSGEAWLYLLAVLINAVNLFLQVFFTIMYSDLEW
jgi:hypothetical protein